MTDNDTKFIEGLLVASIIWFIAMFSLLMTTTPDRHWQSIAVEKGCGEWNTQGQFVWKDK